jgi:hypothetical protein
VGFEPTITASEGAKVVHALDSSAHKQKEPIGGKLRICDPGPQKGRSGHLKTWKHETEAVCACGDIEKAKAGVHLSVDAEGGIGRGSQGEAQGGEVP